MVPLHGRPLEGASNKATSRDIYYTGSYDRISSYEKVVREVNATQILKEKNVVSTRKSVKSDNGKTWNFHRSLEQDAGRLDWILPHKNVRNKKDEISNYHLSNLCDSVTKLSEKVLEKKY